MVEPGEAGVPSRGWAVHGVSALLSWCLKGGISQDASA